MGARLRWRSAVLSILILALCGCAIDQQVHLQSKIALMAPFEGRYREVGYEALYAIRLALADNTGEPIALVAVDDGGSAEMAIIRAQALTADEDLYGVIVLGDAATSEQVLSAFADLPALVIGTWQAVTPGPNVFVLAGSEVPQLLTQAPDISLTELAASEDTLAGAEALALREFALLREDLSDVTVISSGLLPDAQFRDRILGANAFAAEPGLLSTLSYDAARVLLQAIIEAPNRAGVREHLAMHTVDGINGSIAFENGYWKDAPQYFYKYDTSGELYVEP